MLRNARIYPDEENRLLRRIVADFENPSDEYGPTDLRPVLTSALKSSGLSKLSFLSLFPIERTTVAQVKTEVILKVGFDKLQ
jgi:hypothetical protein